MAVSITRAIVKWSLDVLQTLDGIDLGTPSDQIFSSWSHIFTDGTGDDQITGMWHDRRVIAASTDDDLDLAGSLTNNYGETLTFTKIKVLAVRNQSGLVTTGHATATTQIITVVKTATNDYATHNVAVDPDGLFVYTNPKGGITVTAGTADILRIGNPAGGAAQYDIVIAGLI